MKGELHPIKNACEADLRMDGSLYTVFILLSIEPFMGLKVVRQELSRSLGLPFLSLPQGWGRLTLVPHAPTQARD